ENTLTAGLLAVDYFAWSKQSHQGKEMLTIVKRLVDDNGCACPEYISSLLKVYQSCITMSDYETAFGHFYRSWEAGPDVDDLFPLKRAQVMALKCGRSDLVYDAIAEIYKNRGSCLSTIPFLSAMVSFGLEQIGDYEAAERVARDGYACQGAATDDIWLDHAVIHSLYFQGPERQPDALDFFRDHHESWNARQESLIPLNVRIFDEDLWWEGRETTAGMFTSANLEDDHVIANALGLLWKLQCCSSQPSDESAATALRSRWRSVAAVAVAAPSWLSHVDSLLDVLLVRGLVEADRLQDAETL
ncbi:hypothetical protein FOL46_001751, partial [Perkinsus olseni]